MKSYKLGATVHVDASIGLQVREATCEKSMRKLLIKQYLCSRYEEVDCLLKEALRQVSDKLAVWAILKDVILSEKDSEGLFTVNFIYEKLQSYILSDLLKKNDKARLRPSSVERYRFEEIFWENNEVQMHKAYDTELNVSVIAKVFGPYIKLEKANIVIKEALMQAMVAHENVIKILDIWLQKSGNGFKVGIALERLCKDVIRDTAERRRQKHPYTEEELLTFLHQITSALIHAKKFGIAHRDIKPDNIFTEKTGIFKLGNFESAWDAGIPVKSRPIFSFEEWEQRYFTIEISGTVLYLSPEMRQSILGGGDAVDPFVSDVYSLGVAVLEMATLEDQHNLNTNNILDLMQAINTAISSLKYSEAFQSLVRKMLRVDWKRRCSLERIFIQAIDLLGIKSLQVPAAISSVVNALKEKRIYRAMNSRKDVANFPVQEIAHFGMYELKKEENRYEEAVIWLKMAFRKLNLFAEAQLVTKSSYYNKLGELHYKQGNFEKAEKYYMKCLKIRQSVLPENHPDLAASFNNLGFLYLTMGKLAIAEEIFLKSLKIRQNVLPENHSDLAASFKNLGSLYIVMGDSAKAEEYCSKSLKVRQSVLPENHPDLATSFSDLGALYKTTGELEIAEENYLKSLKIRQSVLLENHPDLATSFNDLGALYIIMGDSAKAEEYCLKSLRIRQSVLPENHPDIATSFSDLGALYNKTGELEKAEECYFMGMKIRKIVLPDHHLDLATSFNDLGAFYKNTGELAKAEEYYLKSLRIRQSALPENHPDLAASFNNLGALYKTMGEMEKAEEYFLKGLKSRQSVLPENNPGLAVSFKNLSDLYKNTEELTNAEECLRYLKLRHST